MRFVMIWKHTRHVQSLWLLGNKKVQTAAAIPKQCRAWEVEIEMVSDSNPAHWLQKLYRAPEDRNFTALARFFSEDKMVKFNN